MSKTLHWLSLNFLPSYFKKDQQESKVLGITQFSKVPLQGHQMTYSIPETLQKA